MADAFDRGATTVAGWDGSEARVALRGGLRRGESIGRFVLLDLLGEGGMGVVYAAYDPQLDRKVAIKLLHPTAQSDEARMRLLREAQAMARINHPNVVKVHEAGTFRDQVYVAMEFCDGGTVRGWLDASPRKAAAIVDVFVHAGRGLAAAHDAGLVHRDFKPHNVLLSSDGVVRVTDFGIASLVEHAAPDPATPSTSLPSQLTRTGALIGTPLYMAPEQFAARPATARSDQFSFCVALYEALYGELPFSHATIGELADAVQRGAINPPPAGARVAKWLRRILVRGLSVAEPDRYPAMKDLLSALARDPRRRTRQIITVVAVAAAIGTIALVRRPPPQFDCSGGAGRRAAVWSADRRGAMERAFAASGRSYAHSVFANTAHQIDDWSAAWEHGYRDACEATRVHGEQSERLLDLRMQCLSRRLQETDATVALLATANADAVDHALQAALALPELASCDDTTALLADVAPPNFGVAWRVAAVRAQIDRARALRELGRYRDALAIDGAAVAAARSIGYAPATAEAVTSLGLTQLRLVDPATAGTADDAFHIALSAGAIATAINAAVLRVAALTQSNQLDAARELADVADALAMHTPPSAEVAVRLDTSIGVLAVHRRKLDEAQTRYERALAIAEKLGPDHPLVDIALDHLAQLASVRGKLAEAEQLAQRVVAAHERRYGPAHPYFGNALNNLAIVYKREGKYAEARRVQERALAIETSALGPDHPDVGASLVSLGGIDDELRDSARARSELERAVAIFEHGAPDSSDLFSALDGLGTALEHGHQLDDAKAAYERALRIAETAHGPDDPTVSRVLSNLANIELDRQDYGDAQADLERALRIAETTLGPDHPEVVVAIVNLARVHEGQHDEKGAAALYVKALATGERAYGPDHPKIAEILVNYGVLQLRQKDGAGALASFQRAAPIVEAKLGPQHLLESYALGGEGEALVMVRRASEAIPLYQRALAIRVATGDRQLVGEIETGLADAFAAVGDHARAVAEARSALADFKKVGNSASVSTIEGWLAHH